MGLAEPRKRRKISHDPRNLQWSTSAVSYGQRLMTKQGWTVGQSLGNRASDHLGLNDTERLAAARVGVLFKDDNLGLGAKRRKDDVAAQRVGLDAFQGLLGRLNGKSDQELEREEQKVSDRKLEMYMRGRWGGMTFIRGEILATRKPDGTEDEEENEGNAEDQADAKAAHESADCTTSGPTTDDCRDEKRQRKEDQRLRKAARRKRREEKELRQSAAKSSKSSPTATEGASGASDAEDRPAAIPTTSTPRGDDGPLDEMLSSANPTQPPDHRSASRGALSRSGTSSPLPTTMTNGRHLLRGRNIQAKRMAFSDLKGLDEIFMRSK